MYSAVFHLRSLWAYQRAAFTSITTLRYSLKMMLQQHQNNKRQNANLLCSTVAIYTREYSHSHYIAHSSILGGKLSRSFVCLFVSSAVYPKSWPELENAISTSKEGIIRGIVYSCTPTTVMYCYSPATTTTLSINHREHHSTQNKSKRHNHFPDLSVGLNHRFTSMKVDLHSTLWYDHHPSARCVQYSELQRCFRPVLVFTSCNLH